MDATSIFAAIGQFFTTFLIAGGGIGATSYLMLKFLSSKWLDSKFEERLQNLKSQQDEAVRYVQSTIDREIHRAKKLYDSEFTALSESWKLLRDAYDLSASSIASYTPRVDRLNEDELVRFLTQIGMEEWAKIKILEEEKQERDKSIHVWCEWKRFKNITDAREKFRGYLDANSIFFAEGFTELFRELDTLIGMSNLEFRDRIQHYGEKNELARGFEATQRLRVDGGQKIALLEGMVRTRLWSVARDGPSPSIAAEASAHSRQHHGQQ